MLPVVAATNNAASLAVETTNAALAVTGIAANTGAVITYHSYFTICHK